VTNAKDIKSASQGFDPAPADARVQSVASLLELGIEDGLLPGGTLIASQRGEVFAQLARGGKLPKRAEPETSSDLMELDTVFDLGELTGSICTASLVLRLVSAGKVGVSDRASRYLQALGVGQKSLVTLAHLLSHSAGFPAGVSVYEELVKANTGSRLGILASSGAKQYGHNFFHNLPLKFDPGSKQVASDADMIVAGEICEIVTGVSLDKAFARFVANPLGLRSLSFIDLALMRRRNLSPMVELFAPMGECSKRGRMIVGEPWDENAWVMGGIAGHSGCFGTVHDVHTWAVELVRAYRGDSELFAQEALRSFWSPEIPGIKAGWKLGFEGSSREHGFVESKLAPMAVVASSSTGCSVFIDPLSEVVVVLLSNAGFSGHVSRRFNALRADIHQAVFESA
jgi:CubicO group peptidase (beta-lactamase class C family)